MLRHGWNATAYQILNPGIERWFGREAVIGYVRHGGWTVVAGAPVCAETELAATAQAFEAREATHGRKVCYFATHHRLESALAELSARSRAHGETSRLTPNARVQVGSQPVWRTAEWSATVHGKPSLRAQLHRAQNKQVRVEHWPTERAQQSAELRDCLRRWLDTRGLPPLHFLIETNTLERLADRKVFAARSPLGVIGFTVASPIPRRSSWLVEQTVRVPEAPNGTCELLLDHTVTALGVEGAEMVTLGLSPLSVRCPHQQPASLRRLRFLLHWVRAHGQRFYNFDGLDAYKAKFLPHSWEPLYVVSQHKIGLGTFSAIAGAFAGVSPWRLVSRTLARAVRQEARWLWQRA